ncbi:uncharacterized protein A4U43_C02F2000 [Asparagus officinalis]|uniref:Dirigent protein n=1 Tax=Asparagus officinalis TaxID=4686 RepID=A0A5P1FFV7_ASPOF|nr:uncharacterized protein A4U43_C02F2000 [Asparagus officinalis]
MIFKNNNKFLFLAGWLSVITNVQTLEIGNMTVIEEELISTSPLKGKVQGIYVASLGDTNISMLVIKAVFDGGRFQNSLRFFGEFKPGLSESHIAVVGGSGRYHGANGFAIVKAIDEGVFEGMRKKNKLLFKVYIK